VESTRELGTRCRYLVFGYEICPTTSTPHLQGYIYFDNPKSFKAFKKLLPRSHVEPAVWGPSVNQKYCSKDGKFEEFGARPSTPSEKGSSERLRFAAAFDYARMGQLESIDRDILIRYYGSLRRISSDYMVRISDLIEPCGIWIVGESGIGKSHSARRVWSSAYDKMCNKWWDGYDSEPYVIIDDIDPNHGCLGHHLKIWADAYAFLAESKGFSRRIRPLKIVVTSQYFIQDIWSDSATSEALIRRFKVIVFQEYGTIPESLLEFANDTSDPAIKEAKSLRGSSQ